MDKLRISKVQNGNYILSDYNDERLYVIGQILVDKELRTFFYNQIKHIYEAIKGDTFNILDSSEENHFEFKVDESDNLIINVTDQETKNLLTTDIKRKTLFDLIEQFQEYVDLETQEMLLTRYQDTFILSEEE